MKKIAVIAGAGPAGLTAAYELLKKTEIVPVIFEAGSAVGGLSRTVSYKGNRLDIGGHRFFSKSRKINEWWSEILPLQTEPAADDILLERRAAVDSSSSAESADPEKEDNVMLVRSRLSRIFFLGKFFDYPITVKWDTLANLGLVRMVKIGCSYITVSLFRIAPVKNLEDFFINRFGRELYNTFFKDYTEKVWGVPCCEIKPEWGAQRVKELSVWRIIKHAVRNTFIKDHSLTQEHVETSLIERFKYPKFGPGQLWELVAEKIVNRGGKINRRHTVEKVEWRGTEITGVWVRNNLTQQLVFQPADYFISTMPVKDLIHAMGSAVPDTVADIAAGLAYRDFVTVGLLLKRLKIKNQTKIKTINNIIPDNWVYIQEKNVKIGRMQIFNNWSPYMVSDSNNVWIGLEYFCNENDSLWSKPEKDFVDFAIRELAEINIIDIEDVLDSTVVKVPKAYPVYFGSYDGLPVIRSFADKLVNLYLIGRNGMHRYNNMDHSMLTAIAAADNIAGGVCSKDNIWAVNIEGEYHEEK